MNETIRDILKRVANPLIFGNIIISLCTTALVLETYLELNTEIRWDAFAFLTFFATLFLYNFHRLMGARRIKPEDRGIITGWAASHQFTLFMLCLIGVGGMAFFTFQIKTTIFIILIVLGGVSVLYELPVIKYHERFQKLRNLWVTKIFMITGVWSVATVLLPAINAGFSLVNIYVWIILVERMVFIFILALCFDSRDVEFDERDGVRTVPLIAGPGKTAELYRILCALFFVATFVHYILIAHYWGLSVALTASITITYLAVYKTFPRKNDYYYLFVVDGMMVVQFILLWLFCRI